MKAALFALSALALALPGQAMAKPVLMISIDGLRPGDVIEAEQRGLKIPNLRRMLAQGAHAEGVVGILPTVTYPSHTTLLTGASPAAHGIVNNTTFDPLQINQGGWYWYASDIKVPTLWSAAGAAGLSVGNVHWPVSVGADGIAWNLPQIWRTGHDDDAKLVASLSTPGLLPELERDTGLTYAQGIDESIEGDENRGAFASSMIRLHRPDFVTVYFTALDHQQHQDGPDTPGARAVLERIDSLIGRVTAAELAVHPDATIALVSDHGFEPISHETSLFRAFVDAGLIQLDKGDKVAAWEAMPWPSGGSVAVVLARPDDSALEARVGELLHTLAADPANGIATVADRAGFAGFHANPQASFYLDMRLGWSAAGFAGGAAPLTGTPHYKGTHGYFPSAAHLRSTFLVMGPGIAPGRSLGLIDMRAIAPTLAKVLEVKLDGAELAPLELGK
ncbi:MAG: alkaline phosphatase family protein [Novosphingobium sp.]|uniref:alkaline phosphatase family protein n=1 Tax=Novosphingobium sp. TaxID=1874826 RepID=UPI001D7A345E|nr:ectonucleotide pyrophosphatase/phosphodiesterase [Novosphingobium sp.]MCB2056987.1 alkaline phosphatase family protein [Novosphingobium sp.]MCP5385807.1 alkaline phosphatase family protein [Novosphingobium sp.]